MIQGYVLFTGVIYVTVSLAADLLCAWINPKIRLGDGGKRGREAEMSKRQMIPGIIGIVILTVILAGSVLAPVLAPYEVNAVDMSQTLRTPSAAHLFGTDLLGRDIFSRILYGGRSSILLSLTATVLSMLAGMAVGTLAGYYGGICDDVILVCMNIFQGLPGTSLMIAIAGSWDRAFRV